MAKIEEVPSNDKVRKPTPKKTFSLDNFKKKIGGEDVPDKPLQWIKLSEGFKKATGLPGFAKGYVNLARGHSNTGKSTAVCEGIVAAQKMGDFVIIIDTENNLGRDRLTMMGFDWNGNYLHIDNEYLLENFGKLQDKDRKEAAIEDMAKFMYYILDLQDGGELPFDITFAIDSIGTLNCIKTVNALEKDDSQNNMWNAGAYEKAFMNLLNNTLPNSRKVNKPYTNTLIAVQKIWIDNMNQGVVKHKGGETFYLGSRLIFHFGGIVSHSTKRVTATSKKRELSYGVETKINVAKNHIDGPLGGISMEGKIISTPHGFIYPDDLETYKKANILYFRNLFEDSGIDADEIEMKFRNVDGNGKISFNDDIIEKSEESDD
jgi:hypothetical protein